MVCLCDKFFEGLSIVSISNRVKGIVNRYRLSKIEENYLLAESMQLKDYFDKKTGQDIYKILDIED